MTYLERSKEGRIKGAGFFPVSGEHRIVPISLGNGFIKNGENDPLQHAMDDEKNNNDNLDVWRKNKPQEIENDKVEMRAVPIKLENGEILLPLSTKIETSNLNQHQQIPAEERENKDKTKLSNNDQTPMIDNDTENKDEMNVSNNTANQFWREPSRRYSNTSQNVYNSLKKKTKNAPKQNCKLKTPPTSKKVLPSSRRKSLECQHKGCQSSICSGGDPSWENSVENVNEKIGMKVKNISENNDAQLNNQTKYPSQAALQTQKSGVGKNPFLSEDDSVINNTEPNSNVIPTAEACFACDACTQTERIGRKDACTVM